MTKVVGVRFRNVGKIYYFSPKDYEIKTGDHVIVETARGIEYGKVVLAPREVGEEDVVHPLKEVLRVATKEDDEREAQNRVREREAFKICQKKIREHGLEMKLIDAEYTFDNNKVLFYFTADGRIDFRQLVKDLAAIFKTRIELRQIGVRDETKILGGIGICGRCLCCHTYLSEFAPVSIKMAKEQNLSLNQTKISGVCGRLMCCLKNTGLTIKNGKKVLYEDFGEMMFTHFGVTGPMILSASAHIGAKLAKAPNGELSAYLDLKPALTREQLDARILREFEAGPNKQFKNVIGVLFPSSLTPVMLELGGIPAEKKIHDISREERQHFIDIIKAFPFTITGMGEFKEAIITRGGVSVKEINPGTMESKKISGLYFAGEVLDLDAVTGGYNLQIAWSTAYLAAQAIQ